jgi:hypothetical protein
MKRFLLVVIAFFAACTSPVKEIAKDATKVSDLANSSHKRFEDIDLATRNEFIDVKSIQENTKEGIEEQKTIIEITKSTLVNLTKVEDKVPWWSTMIVYVMVGLSILGSCFLLWYLGIGHLTKALFMRLGWVSSKKMNQASLLTEALDKSSKTTVEEAVAVLRAEDPELNQAFKKIKRGKNANSK